MKTETEHRMRLVLKDILTPSKEEFLACFKDAFQEIFDEGWEEGYKEGFTKGKAEGLATNYRSACVDYSKVVQETKEK